VVSPGRLPSPIGLICASFGAPTERIDPVAVVGRTIVAASTIFIALVDVSVKISPAALVDDLRADTAILTLLDALLTLTPVRPTSALLETQTVKFIHLPAGFHA